MHRRFVDGFFRVVVEGCMFHDIDAAIERKANLLAALGLSSYTEVLGGLVTGHLREEGKASSNYRAFLPYLGPQYVNLNNRYDLYKRIRCGLVHEYFIKGSSTVRMESGGPLNCGIIFHGQECHFVVKKYYRDLKEGIACYRQQLGTNGDLFARFRQSIRPKGAKYWWATVE